MTEGIVPIHGKQYKTVAYRVNEFRRLHPEYTVSTELVEANDTLVVMKASISNDQGRLLATGFAEEVRAASKINRTSALENAETSAIGRALAALGLAGTEYASADEMANAISQQNDGEFLEFMATVRDNFDWVMYAKEAIANEDWQSLAAIWGDIDHETMATLFRAPTKGGIFTTEERAACKGNDAFNQARKELANGV
jgi:hypothetical protein